MLENENLDHKEKFGNNILKALCAFANTNGGTVVIGLSDDGEEIQRVMEGGEGI